MMKAVKQNQWNQVLTCVQNREKKRGIVNWEREQLRFCKSIQVVDTERK